MAERIVRAWGAFIDGKLHTWRDAPVGEDKHLAIYGSRKRAKIFYEDVRRIEIVVIPGK